MARKFAFKERRVEHDACSTFGPFGGFRAMQCSHRAMRHVEAISMNAKWTRAEEGYDIVVGAKADKCMGIQERDWADEDT